VVRIRFPRSNEIVAAASSDDVGRHPACRSGNAGLRWVLIHLVEETGRHAGHADIVRELPDGAKGRLRQDDLQRRNEVQLGPTVLAAFVLSVISKASGRRPPSPARWILQVRPPREHPDALMGVVLQGRVFPEVAGVFFGLPR
jgi:hypothetical protein